MKTEEERLLEWCAKLYSVWVPDWIDIPEDDFKDLLDRPHRKVYKHKKRPKQRAT